MNKQVQIKSKTSQNTAQEAHMMNAENKNAMARQLIKLEIARLSESWTVATEDDRAHGQGTVNERRFAAWSSGRAVEIHTELTLLRKIEDLLE